MEKERVAPSKLPKNYRLIWDIVQSGGNGTHLSMKDVFERALAMRPGMGLSTVYRGLHRLRDLGLVSEIHLPGMDGASYEPVGETHAHFHCRRCGAVSDLPCALPRHVLDELTHDFGIEIEQESVSLSGTCAACRRTE